MCVYDMCMICVYDMYVYMMCVYDMCMTGGGDEIFTYYHTKYHSSTMIVYY